MILVFCDMVDLPALWAAGRLRARGLAVDIVTAQVLESALRWRHGISADGETSIEIELVDGRRISAARPAAVLNRLWQAPRSRVDRVGGDDRDYAAQEMSALFLSWLNALPGPVINRPTPQGLGGRWRHPSQWTVLAAEAGLAMRPYHQSDRTDPDQAWIAETPPDAVPLFVVDGEAVGPPQVPPSIRGACVRLASVAGELLLGFDLVQRDGGWLMANATPMPDLMRGGEALVDALARALAPADMETREEALAG